jgi:hypothetical protein
VSEQKSSDCDIAGGRLRRLNECCWVSLDVVSTNCQGVSLSDATGLMSAEVMMPQRVDDSFAFQCCLCDVACQL